ncbi:MAG: fumarylacetoacetase [Acetobacteraceae bacterium]
MTTLDETHDPARRSWVDSANGHPEFPIQNLPLGVFSTAGGAPRPGVAIGDRILDLKAASEAGFFTGPAREAAEAASGAGLNAMLALGAEARRALRRRLGELLDVSADRRELLLHKTDDCVMHLPAAIGDYTDFFAGIAHATNTGKLFRPDNPLLPNYKYIPVAYHGRASSVRPSGAEVRRPCGQRKLPGQAAPDFGPCRNLDYELEIGMWIGPGNALGQPIPIGEAGSHIAGYCLLNDWSARDIQAWEYVPLGPFLAKSFCTSVSPWIVTAEALAPFRIAQAPRSTGDPAPLPHLLDAGDQADGALDIALEAALLTQAMRGAGAAPYVLSRTTARALSWTPAQMVAHHSSNGCDLRAGDLFGSGTISGEDASSFGSLLEITHGGRDKLSLPNGETRGFLEDGDEVILTARCARAGAASIGFGPCRGRVAPAAERAG